MQEFNWMSNADYFTASFYHLQKLLESHFHFHKFFLSMCRRAKIEFQFGWSDETKTLPMQNFAPFLFEKYRIAGRFYRWVLKWKLLNRHLKDMILNILLYSDTFQIISHFAINFQLADGNYAGYFKEFFYFYSQFA